MKSETLLTLGGLALGGFLIYNLTRKKTSSYFDDDGLYIPDATQPTIRTAVRQDEKTDRTQIRQDAKTDRTQIRRSNPLFNINIPNFKRINKSKPVGLNQKIIYKGDTALQTIRTPQSRVKAFHFKPQSISPATYNHKRPQSSLRKPSAVFNI